MAMILLIKAILIVAYMFVGLVVARTIDRRDDDAGKPSTYFFGVFLWPFVFIVCVLIWSIVYLLKKLHVLHAAIGQLVDCVDWCSDRMNRFIDWVNE